MKKKRILYLFILSTFFGCKDNDHNESNLIVESQDSTIVDQFNPELVEDYYKSGNIKIRTHSINGKENGTRVEYFDSDEILLKSISTYKEGVKIDTAYVFYPSGGLKTINIYSREGKVFKREFYSEEGVLFKERYLIQPHYLDKPTINMEKVYNADGSLDYNKGFFYEIFPEEKKIGVNEQELFVKLKFFGGSESLSLVYGEINEDYSYDKTDTIDFIKNEVSFPIKRSSIGNNIARFIIIDSKVIIDPIKGEGMVSRFICGKYEYEVVGNG